MDEEHNCYYINSMGFRKSADIYSLDDGDNISTYDLMDYKFHNTYRNYQDSNHLVMNIPRGGFDTRHLEKKNKFKNI